MGMQYIYAADVSELYKRVKTIGEAPSRIALFANDKLIDEHCRFERGARGENFPEPHDDEEAIVTVKQGHYTLPDFDKKQQIYEYCFCLSVQKLMKDYSIYIGEGVTRERMYEYQEDKNTPHVITLYRLWCQLPRARKRTLE